MPVLIVLIGVLLLLLLITAGKLNAFIAFILVALFVGVAEGLPALKAAAAIQKGIGDTLGSLVMILGFGAMFGKLVAESGAASRITQQMVAAFGLRHVRWALLITGLIVGIPMFYTVGFVIMVPLVFTVAATTRLPLLAVALPMLASLSVTHAYLPPHPSPTAISEMFHADMGKTLLLGLVLAIPAAALVVPLSSALSKRFQATPKADFIPTDHLPDERLPSTAVSFIIALLPVVLIGTAAASTLFTPEQSFARTFFATVGDPVIAMLITVLAAMYFLGLRCGRKPAEISGSLTQAVEGITMVLLTIGGAGALKEVLVQSGVSDYIGSYMNGSGISPLILAWGIAAVIRISIGSATVAGMTAAGIVLPLTHQAGVSPELMVLSIGAGSIFFSHVNDGGFWLFKEYFNLSVKETFATWSLMETIVSLVGLIGVLVLDAVLKMIV
jgi:Gnt-I system high-affinity gluconate transporter